MTSDREAFLFFIPHQQATIFFYYHLTQPTVVNIRHLRRGRHFNRDKFRFLIIRFFIVDKNTCFPLLEMPGDLRIRNSFS